MKPLFTLGADPEFFLRIGNSHKSAVGLIGGSKDHPTPLEKDGHAILEDNVAVEFNIAPAHNHKEFIENISYVMAELRARLPPFMEFSQESAVVFDPMELDTEQAQQFGCEPDYNAWTGDRNPRPCASDQNLRSAGGHVHVGVDGVDARDIIKAMDLFVGVPATKIDSGKLRRQLYGKAGCYRPKPYGAEYRTLSNFWIFSPTLMQWVYDQTAKAVEFCKRGNTLTDDTGLIIQAAINDEDKDAYEHLVHTYGLA